jgi:glycosyltransferase involved in cell wall biosynthesis
MYGKRKQTKMRMVTLYLKTENVHLLKDVGMLPWFMMKEHGIDCAIATWKNSEEYTYIDNEVRGLKLEFVPRSGHGREIDGILYLIKNAKRIDILNIYHLNLSSYLYEIVYRLFNRRGCIYLKLDMNPAGFISCFKKNPVGMIKRATIRRADIASVETTAMKKKLRKFFGDKIIYIPNGCYMGSEEAEEAKTADKDNEIEIPRKNIILTVGNLGTYEKATDVLMDAFALYAAKSKRNDWSLRLVGSVDESFREYIVDFYKKHPELEKRVTFTGPVTDKARLDREYRQAKVFTLPSLSESFGIVLVEAASRGCYLITSDMVPAGYDISHRYENGMAVGAGDAGALSEAFLKVCDGERDWDKTAEKTAAYVKAAYDWSKIVDRLYSEISLVL